MQAEFPGAVQMLVYAGGIMVLFLFVIMLVHQRTVKGDEGLPAPVGHRAAPRRPVLLVPFLYILWTEKFADMPEKPDALRVGRRKGRSATPRPWPAILYRDYLLPFEVASIFLLVAMIGAVVLGKRSTEKMD